MVNELLSQGEEDAMSQSMAAQAQRDKILSLEAAMFAMPEHQIKVEIVHHFAPGLYGREMRVPAGACLVGKIHKTEHLCVLSKGDVTVIGDSGPHRIQASTVVHSLPGTKRAILAHEDSVWINFHHNPTNERDTDHIEDIFIAKTFEDAYLSTSRSFSDALRFIGVTAEECSAISDNERDFVDFQPGPASVRLAPSLIHGIGVFAERRFSRGDVIALARAGHLRTPVGRYCNHDGSPNAEMIQRENGDMDLVAIVDIDFGQEVLTDYFINFTRSRKPAGEAVPCLSPQ